MQILTKPEELASLCRGWHKAGDDIALTQPWAIIMQAMRIWSGTAENWQNGLLSVSLSIRTQFGPTWDLAAYPRDIESDCAKAGVLEQMLFLFPSHRPCMPLITLPGLKSCACFRIVRKEPPLSISGGVCTVVLKLMLLTGADYAVFGQKDWQQQAIIRRMVRDLNVPCTIVTIPTVREDDGLAMSSRNVYLKPKERKAAPPYSEGASSGPWNSGQRWTIPWQGNWCC